MKLLLDTHIVLAFVDQDLEDRFPAIARDFARNNPDIAISAASIWEIAIKTRLKKLNPRIDPHLIPSYLRDLGLFILDITHAHVTADISPDILTRDPFDRLLLAQAQIEGMRFVTIDSALIDHPLSFRV